MKRYWLIVIVSILSTECTSVRHTAGAENLGDEVATISQSPDSEWRPSVIEYQDLNNKENRKKWVLKNYFHGYASTLILKSGSYAIDFWCGDGTYITVVFTAEKGKEYSSKCFINEKGRVKVEIQETIKK